MTIESQDSLKSNVLLHFIDGFIIEESDAPFTVKSGSVLTKSQFQDIWRKQQELIKKEAEKRDADTSFTEEPLARNVNRRCELCGALAPEKYSNRFCSLLCSRRYNASNARQYKMKFQRVKTRNKIARNETKNSYVPNDTPPLSPVNPYVPSSTDQHGETVPLSPSKWTVNDVCKYIKSLPESSVFEQDFRNQEIDGSALLLLKEDHLISSLNIKLGPALKLCSYIRKLQS